MCALEQRLRMQFLEWGVYSSARLEKPFTLRLAYHQDNMFALNELIMARISHSFAFAYDHAKEPLGVLKNLVRIRPLDLYLKFLPYSELPRHTHGTYTRSHIHTYTDTSFNTYTDTCTQTLAYTLTRTCAYLHARKNTNTQSRTHTHTHTRAPRRHKHKQNPTYAYT